MRRRVAIFANAWGSQFLQEVGGGISRCAKEQNIDLFSFVNYSVYGGEVEDNLGEVNIFRLPDLSDFDGVILATNSFNLEEEKDYLIDKVRKSGKPAVSLEYEVEGMPYVGTNNYEGMYQLMKHVVEEHKIQNLIFINGIRNHMESEVRLQAVRDAIDGHDIDFPEENIIYGDWAAAHAVNRLDTWFQNHDFLPDAVICANDIMAIGVCEWLQAQGYSVPEDIIVTGYDFIMEGQILQPALTTVSHSWDSMGYQAMQVLINEMEGKEYPDHIEINTSFVCGESCGCHEKSTDVYVKQNISWINVDQRFRHLYKVLRKVETAEELNRNLSEFITAEGDMEGEDFMLCLHPNFFDYNDGEDMLYRTQGFYECIDAVCAMHKGAVRKRLKMNSKRAMFQNADASETPGSYIIVSVRSDAKSLGYAILSKDFDIVQDNLLYIWTRHMNQYMEQIRNNVKLAALAKKLEDLSVIDGLTGVYNRAGCTKIMIPAMEKCQAEGGQSISLIVDVDRMKLINDNFGHISGDVALKMVAEVLKNTLPSRFLICRFGGDEFFAVGESDGIVTIDEIVASITETLRKEVEKQKVQFSLSVSIGGFLLEKGEAYEMERCVREADSVMYKMKERHHEQADRKTE